MSITEIELYTALQHKLGDKEAQQLVEFVKAEVKDSFDARSEHLATKENVANAKVDIIRWMLVFWVGTVGVLAGIMFALLNAYFKH